MISEWRKHLLACFDRGAEDFKSGIFKDWNPYQEVGPEYDPDRGGTLKRQRETEWLQGWESVARESRERRCLHCGRPKSKHGLRHPAFPEIEPLGLYCWSGDGKYRQFESAK